MPGDRRRRERDGRRHLASAARPPPPLPLILIRKISRGGDENDESNRAVLLPPLPSQKAVLSTFLCPATEIHGARRRLLKISNLQRLPLLPTTPFSRGRTLRRRFLCFAVLYSFSPLRRVSSHGRLFPSAKLSKSILSRRRSLAHYYKIDRSRSRRLRRDEIFILEILARLRASSLIKVSVE